MRSRKEASKRTQAGARSPGDANAEDDDMIAVSKVTQDLDINRSILLTSIHIEERLALASSHSRSMPQGCTVASSASRPRAVSTTCRDRINRLSPCYLTASSPPHKLGSVERLIGGLVALVLTMSPGQVPQLHIHWYTDHDHPEHHHGLAAHEHSVSGARTTGADLLLKDCDPSRHKITFSFACAAPPRASWLDAELVTPVVRAPEPPPLHSLVDLTEIRVHGPPPRTQSTPRAPPSSVPA